MAVQPETNPAGPGIGEPRGARIESDPTTKAGGADETQAGSAAPLPVAPETLHAPVSAAEAKVHAAFVHLVLAPKGSVLAKWGEFVALYSDTDTKALVADKVKQLFLSDTPPIAGSEHPLKNPDISKRASAFLFENGIADRSFFRGCLRSPDVTLGAVAAVEFLPTTTPAKYLSGVNIASALEHPSANVRYAAGTWFANNSGTTLIEPYATAVTVYMITRYPSDRGEHGGERQDATFGQSKANPIDYATPARVTDDVVKKLLPLADPAPSEPLSPIAWFVLAREKKGDAARLAHSVQQNCDKLEFELLTLAREHDASAMLEALGAVATSTDPGAEKRRVAISALAQAGCADYHAGISKLVGNPANPTGLNQALAKYYAKFESEPLAVAAACEVLKPPAPPPPRLGFRLGAPKAPELPKLTLSDDSMYLVGLVAKASEPARSAALENLVNRTSSGDLQHAAILALGPGNELARKAFISNGYVPNSVGEPKLLMGTERFSTGLSVTDRIAWADRLMSGSLTSVAKVQELVVGAIRSVVADVGAQVTEKRALFTGMAAWITKVGASAIEKVIAPALRDLSAEVIPEQARGDFKKLVDACFKADKTRSEPLRGVYFLVTGQNLPS